MADPLSVAGLATGLVSLGLQVYNGISTYLDAIHGRDVDLALVRRNAKGIEDTVRIIERYIPQFQTQRQTVSSLVKESIQSCEGELVSAQQFLLKLETSNSSDASFKNSLRKQKQKLTYPFHRPHLDRLEHRLEIVSGALQTALLVLGM